ncbi:MAG: hypothetical protein ACFFG0_26805 [Candidatus Thorarchaeota archaeon]
MVKIKAQAWSMDIALAVVIFIVAFFVIYNIATTRTPSDVSNLYQEAERISKEATSENSTLSVVSGEVLNETKIQNLLGEDYSELKKKVRVEHDFCIYFEDDEGNIIKIQDASGIGSSEINISGIECS